MNVGRYIVMFLLGCIVSGYYYPFSFSFLPESLNTKQIIGVLGILAFVIKCLKERKVEMQRMVVVSALIAIAFSVWCYFSMIDNGTDDTSYATYIVSYAVWLGGAFGMISLIKAFHGYCNLQLITKYLAVVAVAQCILAQIIDNNVAFQTFVDTWVEQGQVFLHEVDRIYGIGASLDPAGVRFASVLILIGHQITVNRKVTDSNKLTTVYIISFFIILVLGNLISRTTTVGGALALVYIFLFFGFAKGGVLTQRQLRFYGILAAIIVVGATVLVTLYNTNPDFRAQLRFGFEGFFNLFEQGEFRTDSSDKLQGEMWIWPETDHDWLIGRGRFAGWVYSTDIGYCRFTLYCGLIGLSIFTLLFLYCAYAVTFKFKKMEVLSLFILSLTFVIWVKVATDLFFIYAILFSIDGDYDEDGNEIDWNARLTGFVEPDTGPELET